MITFQKQDSHNKYYSTLCHFKSWQIYSRYKIIVKQFIKGACECMWVYGCVFGYIMSNREKQERGKWKRMKGGRKATRLTDPNQYRDYHTLELTNQYTFFFEKKDTRKSKQMAGNDYVCAVVTYCRGRTMYGYKIPRKWNEIHDSLQTPIVYSVS